ncbi:MAG TPA: VCBS repeat-containing protein, partial [Thermoanaerobaculia bacterium]|nr:VCBS repeat-containing protein [Thermoanaerobaculia bacterium]
RNDGGGHFTSRQVTVHSIPHPHTVAAADVNGDGHVDLITDSWEEKRLTLLLADGHNGWLTPGTPVEIGREPYINVVAADLDGDGHVDLVMPNAGPENPSDTVSILFGDGHGGFRHAAQSPIVAGPKPFMIAVADVNGDGRPDILVSNYSGHINDTSGDGLTWIRNDGQRHFTAFPQRSAIGHGCWRIAGGNLNGDAFADAAFINAADGTVSVVYGSASGPRPGPTIPVMPEPHNVVMANLHQDKRADLLVITEERDELLVISFR